MGTYTGTDASELIKPGDVSASVTADPPGSSPSPDADTLIGGGGDDWLDGGEGSDTMMGGDGDDIYVVRSRGDVVTEAASSAGGVDTVGSSISYTLGAELENLVLNGSAPISGTGNGLDNRLTGNKGDNVLKGEAGNDWLDGDLGTDTLIGGAGNDTYVIDDAGDVVTEDTTDAGGLDTVLSSITLVLDAGLESLTLTGSQAINGTGNSSDNVLVGNDGKNVLKAGAGEDMLSGLDGADTLKGGEGEDTLDGGMGKDKLAGGAGNDQFVFSKPTETGDTITDFSSKNGNNDRFVIEASGFKGGLDDGKLSRDQFQTSDNHDAQEADVRFIFDTSDNTLWFDKNGSKAGGLTLIADLQASATVEANDIWLV